MDTLRNLQPGSVVFRGMPDRREKVRVLRVEDDVIICTPFGEPVEQAIENGRVWTFDRTTGRELPTDLGFYPPQPWQVSQSWLLDDAPAADRALSADERAERLLWPLGRMLTLSQPSYDRAHPTHVVIYNANLCTERRGKIWFGDLDLTRDESALGRLAGVLGERVYVLPERAARFRTEEAPLLEEYVLRLDPDGTTSHQDRIVRGEDGRLRLKSPSDG